jgi:diadenosine tetraphosphatase ApaH/serine/threonine PP2A family protein phosphatase
MGNSDDWLLTGEESDGHPISEERRKTLEAVRGWSLSKLSDSDREFIRTFEPTVEIPLGPRDHLFCFHGSPASYDHFILPSTPEDEFQGMLGAFADRILTGGHMHLQFQRRLGDSKNFFFNPGSVGLAYNHEQSLDQGLIDPWAEYALLTIQGLRISLEFHRVPIDLDSMADLYEQSDMPFADTAMEKYIRYPG